MRNVIRSGLGLAAAAGRQAHRPGVTGVVAVALVLGLAVVARAEEKKIVVDGSTTVGPIAKAFAEYLMSQVQGLNITVGESGSGNGAKSLINGTCDIADMSRFMKDKEFSMAIEKGIYPVAHVVAMDGIAVVVHPSNPIANLTLEQLRDIYSGKIGNWKDLKGPDVPIVRISRDTNSGTYETFEHIVMNGEKIAADTEYVGSNGQARQRIMSTPGAIGYVGLGFSEGVKTMTINGIEPSRETVARGVYPVARPLYMFTNGYPKLGSPLYNFVTLHLSPKGQEIIESIGYVPVTSYPSGARLAEHQEKPAP